MSGDTEISQPNRKCECEVKPQYLNRNLTPRISTHLPTDVKDDILRSLNKSNTTDAKTNTDTASIEFSKEPIRRLRGTNIISKESKNERSKKRRTNTAVECEAQLSRCYKIYRLCSSVVNENKKESCSFGESCKFSHDVEAYLRDKPLDISDQCYIFNQFGQCPYGVTCRYARSHVNQVTQEKKIDNQTITSLDTKSITDGKPSPLENETWPRNEKNVIERKLLMSLRRKMYNFSTADDIIKNKIPSVIKNYKAQPRDDDTKQRVDFIGKLILAPLTTVGNLPFRRICKEFGADITCSEMALATNLLQGQQMKEWALLRRHTSEDIFGIQLCGSNPESLTRCTQLLCENVEFDFIDLNVGCPIDMIFNKGGGSALLGKPSKLGRILTGMRKILDDSQSINVNGDSTAASADSPSSSVSYSSPLLSNNSPPSLTVKLRTGIFDGRNTAHDLIPYLCDWGLDMISLHGRSRQQRYHKLADWNYISQCGLLATRHPRNPTSFFGVGDILSYEDYQRFVHDIPGISGAMIARGALIKPWIFTEIKESRHWDIRSTERLDILRRFTNYGLEHWGSDQHGVDLTRSFLLEWLSFTHRYVPLGILERPPQKINERPPSFFGRDDLETLMGSTNCDDWIKISEMLLGPVSENFHFIPKHKANAYR